MSGANYLSCDACSRKTIYVGETDRPQGMLAFCDRECVAVFWERHATAVELSRSFTCPKAPHDDPRGGYLHNPDDDGPYDVDGIPYCGRCHGVCASATRLCLDGFKS